MLHKDAVLPHSRKPVNAVFKVSSCFNWASANNHMPSFGVYFASWPFPHLIFIPSIYTFLSLNFLGCCMLDCLHFAMWMSVLECGYNYWQYLMYHWPDFFPLRHFCKRFPCLARDFNLSLPSFVAVFLSPTPATGRHMGHLDGNSTCDFVFIYIGSFIFLCGFPQITQLSLISSNCNRCSQLFISS